MYASNHWLTDLVVPNKQHLLRVPTVLRLLSLNKKEEIKMKSITLITLEQTMKEIFPEGNKLEK